MLKNILLIFFITLFLTNISFSQEDSLEIFVIDGYVTPEKPHTFILSFFTSFEVKSRIIVNNDFEISISENYMEDHSAEIDFSSYKFSNKFIPYQIITEDQNGNIISSENYEIVLPYEEFIETKEGASPIPRILLGMILYFTPSPTLTIVNKEEYFSLSKEIPFLTFYSSGYNYPIGNISFEYSHIYESNQKDIYRLGYKHIIPIDVFEFVSPGLTGFSDLNGYNGIGTEVSVGFFKIFDIFTIYSRYRYNFDLSASKQDFQEVSLGIHSLFFTIDY